jgi:hypothetical protein
MKKLINSDDGAITDALAGMAAAHPSRVAGGERPGLARRWNAPVNTSAPWWER